MKDERKAILDRGMASGHNLPTNSKRSKRWVLQN
jgi:hypothetical protein